eukprot:7388412-Prymnesium_polylepis.1
MAAAGWAPRPHMAHARPWGLSTVRTHMARRRHGSTVQRHVTAHRPERRSVEHECGAGGARTGTASRE